MSVKDILTTKEVAEWLRVEKRFVLKLVHTKELSARKIGGLYVFDPEEVSQFIMKQDLLKIID